MRGGSAHCALSDRKSAGEGVNSVDKSPLPEIRRTLAAAWIVLRIWRVARTAGTGPVRGLKALRVPRNRTHSCLNGRISGLATQRVPPAVVSLSPEREVRHAGRCWQPLVALAVAVSRRSNVSWTATAAGVAGTIPSGNDGESQSRSVALPDSWPTLSCWGRFLNLFPLVPVHVTAAMLWPCFSPLLP